MFNGNKQGPFTGFGAEEELSLLNSWLSSDLCEGDLFFDKLYENRRRTVNLKIKNFKARVSNYLYKRKLGSLESKTDIEKSSISSSIQPVLNEIEKQLPTRTQDLDIFKDIISMKYKGYLGKTANSTINGWFVKPTRLIEGEDFWKFQQKGNMCEFPKSAMNFQEYDHYYQNLMSVQHFIKSLCNNLNLNMINLSRLILFRDLINL